MRLDRNSGCTIEALTSTPGLCAKCLFAVLRIPARFCTISMYAGMEVSAATSVPNRDSDVRSWELLCLRHVKYYPEPHPFVLSVGVLIQAGT